MGDSPCPGSCATDAPMKQLTLRLAQSACNIPKWEKIGPAPYGALGGTWRHRSGWIVQHCGHPTANWPYYAISPRGDSPIVGPSGRGFLKLQHAQAAVEGLIARIWKLSKDGRILCDYNALTLRPR